MKADLNMTSSPTLKALHIPEKAAVDDVGDVDVVSGSNAAFVRSVGRMIQALRVGAGLTQAELGERIGYGEEMVSKVERGIRIPRAEFIGHAERVLDAHGVLAAMKDELSRASYSGIVRSVHQEEARAVGIPAYDTHVLNTLLQTEDYMRALLTMHPLPLATRTLEQRVSTRLERQKIFRREPTPPVLSFVMDETLLRRPYGGRAVPRGQLEHLIQVGQLPHVDLQVMPLEQERHAGTGGPFTLVETGQRTRIAYTEVQNTRVHTERHRIPDLEATYSRIRAHALPPMDTLVLIEKLLSA